MHCGDQPFPHQLASSDLDVALPAGTGDEQYLQVTSQAPAAHTGSPMGGWQAGNPPPRAHPCPCPLQALHDALPPLLERLQPQLVLYNAGVDVHAEDSLGLLTLTDSGILQRDRFVMATCAQHGAPVAAAIGGGYAKNHDSIVDRHMLLHRATAEFYPQLAACGTAAKAQQRRAAAAG